MIFKVSASPRDANIVLNPALWQRPPQAPGIVSNILPFLPPHYARGIITLLRYASLGMQVWKDGCLLIFLLGMTAILA